MTCLSTFAGKTPTKLQLKASGWRAHSLPASPKKGLRCPLKRQPGSLPAQPWKLRSKNSLRTTQSRSPLLQRTWEWPTRLGGPAARKPRPNASEKGLPGGRSCTPSGFSGPRTESVFPKWGVFPPPSGAIKVWVLAPSNFAGLAPKPPLLAGSRS